VEILAHLLLLAAFAAMLLRRRRTALALFLFALLFTLFVFHLHVTDALPLSF
jgi:hypothetical protein